MSTRADILWTIALFLVCAALIVASTALMCDGCNRRAAELDATEACDDPDDPADP